MSIIIPIFSIHSFKIVTAMFVTTGAAMMRPVTATTQSARGISLPQPEL
jgi:hypothetical protein